MGEGEGVRGRNVSALPLTATGRHAETGHALVEEEEEEEEKRRHRFCLHVCKTLPVCLSWLFMYSLTTGRPHAALLREATLLTS